MSNSKTPQASISIAIATYNEESNIKRCLEAVVDWVDEIIIADGSSTDNTVKIAKTFPKVKVITTDNKPLFHINKNLAIDACSKDWILQLDADEVVTPALASEIKSLLKKDPVRVTENGFWIKRQNYFLGTFFKKGGQYPDPTLRLYKNGLGRLPCQDVHEQAQVTPPTGWLQNDIQHYADPSFSRYLLRHNRYTTLSAKELRDNKLPLTPFTFLDYFLVKPAWWFILAYFRHKGFVDGFPGFVFALFSALRFPIIYIKYWELQKSNRPVSLSQDWDN